MKKEYRIKKNEEISSIVLKKKRVGCPFFVIYYQPGTEKMRVAVSASKKYGNSVERNHAKRIIREVVRPNIFKYSPMNIVVVVKQDLKKTSFEDVKSSMVRCLNIINHNIKKDGGKR